MSIERSRIRAELIAPCGMNCAVCRAYLRPRNPCHGCRDAQLNNPKTRLYCRLRVCSKRTGDFCFDCAEFPCQSLKRLDLRYRNRYGMSEIDNLVSIRETGMRKFLEDERGKYLCEKGIFCVHDRKYY